MPCDFLPVVVEIPIFENHKLSTCICYVSAAPYKTQETALTALRLRHIFETKMG
jgi:hypothetical protein